MGKGGKRRPTAVERKQYEEEFDRIFSKPVSIQPEPTNRKE